MEYSLVCTQGKEVAPHSTPFLGICVKIKKLFLHLQFFWGVGARLSLANCWFSLSPRLWHFLSHHFSRQQFLITKIISPYCLLQDVRESEKSMSTSSPHESIILGNQWPTTTALLDLSSRGTGFLSQEGVNGPCLFYSSSYFQGWIPHIAILVSQ